MLNSIKIACAIIVGVLVVCNFHICNYFIPGDDAVSVLEWWNLKENIYNFILIIPLISSMITEYKYGSVGVFVIWFFVAYLLLFNVIDRIFFDIKRFTTSDYIVILIGILLSLRIYKTIHVRKAKRDTRC